MGWGAPWWCREYWRYCRAGHPGGRHGWLSGQPGVQHGWQLTHDGNNRQLTARQGGGQQQRQEYLTYCWVNDGKGARHNTRWQQMCLLLIVPLACRATLLLLLRPWNMARIQPVLVLNVLCIPILSEIKFVLAYSNRVLVWGQGGMWMWKPNHVSLLLWWT